MGTYSKSENDSVNTKELNSKLLNIVANNESVDDARRLIKQGADVNSNFSNTLHGGFDSKAVEEWSLLDAAVRVNDISMIRLLLESGANPNSGRWYPQTYKYGMEAGLDFWSQGAFFTGNREFYCALSEAIWNTKNLDVVKLLLQFGANPNYTCTQKVVRPPDEHPRFEPRLYESKTHSGLTDAIVFSGDSRFVEELLKAGANPKIKYEYMQEEEYTTRICKIPSLDVAIVKNKKRVVELLLDAGASFEETCDVCYIGRDQEFIPLKKRAYNCDESLKRVLKQHGWKEPIFFGRTVDYKT